MYKRQIYDSSPDRRLGRTCFLEELFCKKGETLKSENLELSPDSVLDRRRSLAGGYLPTQGGAGPPSRVNGSTGRCLSATTLDFHSDSYSFSIDLDDGRTSFPIGNISSPVEESHHFISIFKTTKDTNKEIPLVISETITSFLLSTKNVFNIAKLLVLARSFVVETSGREFSGE